MQMTHFKSIVLGVMSLLVLASCGGDKAGGTGEFATVFAVAGTGNGQLDSDVATWVTETGTAAPACGENSLISTEPDIVNYAITSTAFSTPNTGSSTTITPSPLVVSEITLTLTPADTISPVLPQRFRLQFPSAAAAPILPNTTATIPVRIVDHDLKSFFLSGDLGAQSISCANNVLYSYRAVVSFKLLEVNTNRESTVTPQAPLLVRFGDFADQ